MNWTQKQIEESFDFLYSETGFAKLEIKEDKLNKIDLTGELLLSEVCKYKGCHIDLVKSKTKKREVVRTRWLFGNICRLYFPKMSLSEIGSYFGQDHATILHGRKTYNNDRSLDKNRGTFQSREMTIDINNIVDLLGEKYDVFFLKRELI